MPQSVLTRRRFLHCAGGAAAAGLLGAICGQSAAAEQPLLRFVQWNDMHIDSSPSGSDYRLANEKMAYLVSSLNACTYFPVPDFVLGLGDLITGEGAGLPKIAADFALLKTLTAGLKCPLYPIMGNHENTQREGDSRYEALFREAFGDDRINYTLQRGGLLFVMLNNSGSPESNSKDAGDRRIRWLRETIETSGDVPIIL